GRAGRRLAARVGIVPPAQNDSSDWLTASRSHSDAGRVGHCLHYEECRPTCQGAMIRFLWSMRPYFRQVAGELLLGSLAGIVMNTAVVLPAILLGHAIDTALAFSRGEVAASAVSGEALLFIAGTLATEIPRVFKRWFLITANGRMRANLRADLLRGVLAWPMARVHESAIGDLMARIVGDVEVWGVGMRRLVIETWDTLLFTLSFVVAMLWYDAGLTLVVLSPTP